MESNYNLREEDIKEGIRLCYQKVNSLLDNAETILTQRGDREIGSGLYTYAVEELGKLLLLQDSLKQKKIPTAPSRLIWIFLAREMKVDIQRKNSTDLGKILQYPRDVKNLDMLKVVLALVPLLPLFLE